MFKWGGIDWREVSDWSLASVISSGMMTAGILMGNPVGYGIAVAAGSMLVLACHQVYHLAMEQ